MLIDLSGTGHKTRKQNCTCLSFTCKTNIHTFSVLSILWKKLKSFNTLFIYLFGLFMFLLIVLCVLDVISGRGMYIVITWVVCFLPYWSVSPLNKFIDHSVCSTFWWITYSQTSSTIVKTRCEWKEFKFLITSLLLPNYHDYKKDINENENTSNCFPDDLITLAAFSICE